VVTTYGRDMRPQDIDSALQKLVDWDKQLEEAQNFIENRIMKECNQSKIDNYDRQFKESEDMARKRDEVLRDLTGSHTKSDIKKQSSGAAGFLSSFTKGFLNR
jgi:hypothetical protein